MTPEGVATTLGGALSRARRSCMENATEEAEVIRTLTAVSHAIVSSFGFSITQTKQMLTLSGMAKGHIQQIMLAEFGDYT